MIKETKQMICILCPRGCHLVVNGEVVSGNFCKRGIRYAISEATNPVRNVSSKVRVKSGEYAFVSVKTNKGVVKNAQSMLVAHLKTVEVEAPIQMGDVILPNVLGIGVDIIATRSIKKGSLS